MSNQTNSLKKIIYKFISNYRIEFFSLFLILLIEGAVSALSVLSIVPLSDFLIDPLLTNPSRVTKFLSIQIEKLGLEKNFITFSSLFIISNFIKGVLDVGIRYLILKIKYIVVKNLIYESVEAFFSARWLFFSGANHGKLLNSLTKELNTIGDTFGHLATMMSQLVQLAIYLIIPFLLSPFLTISTIAITLIFSLPLIYFQKYSYKLGLKNTETAGNSMSILSEILSASRIILGYGRQKEAREAYIQSFESHISVTIKFQTFLSLIGNLLKPIGITGALISLGIALSRGENISDLTGVLWSLLSTLSILNALLQGNLSLRNFIPSFESLENLKSVALDLKEIPGSINYKSFDNSIRLNGIYFSYPGRESTLSDISLEIQKGKMTALIGQSGSGKSTITDILLGMQIPSEGEVLIDGIPLKDFNQNSFRYKVGYVPQDSFLFHSSIKDNLLWSNPHATDDQIWKSLEMANAKMFVLELPNDIDTIVGDRGTKLSGGQRQRIALARALVRNPDLLILDEATSSLDAESEKLIQESIDNLAGSMTIFVIAHRLSTIQKADYTYVLNKGKIVEIISN